MLRDKHDKLCLLTHRIGRRGGALLFLAFLDLAVGISLLCPTKAMLASPAYSNLRQILPLSSWAVIWLLVGAVCLIGAFTKRDGLSFASAISLKTVWGLVNLFGWFTGVTREGVGPAIWLAFAGFILVLSGWPEPGCHIRREE